MIDAEINELELRLLRLQNGSADAQQRSAVLRKVQESRETDIAVAAHLEEVRQWRMERDREEEQLCFSHLILEARQSEEAAIKLKMMTKGTPEEKLREKEAELVQRQMNISKASSSPISYPLRSTTSTTQPSRGVVDAERILEEVKREHAEKKAAMWLQHAKELHAVETRKLEFSNMLHQRAIAAQGMKECEQQFWEVTMKDAWCMAETRREEVHEERGRLAVEICRNADYENIRSASQLMEMAQQYAAMSRRLMQMAQVCMGQGNPTSHLSLLFDASQRQNTEKGKGFPGLTQLANATLAMTPMTPQPFPKILAQRGRDMETQTPVMKDKVSSRQPKH